MSQTHVTDTGDRFEIRVDGAPAGFTEYREEAGARVFTHTQIDQDYSGQGLGSILIRDALDATRAEGRAVVPQCDFVRGYIAKHPDYLELVPAERRAELGLG